MSIDGTDEPIRQLAGLVETPRPGFAGRVRTSIERRRLASELTELTWQGLGLLLLEYIEMPLELFGSPDPKSEGPDERGDR